MTTPSLLGIDTGGTFTDFVLYDGQGLRIHKVLSTPAAPEQAVLQGIRELGFALNKAPAITHGSTVATNAVLEGKGVRTVFISNRGFGDMLSIGRQARRSLYALQPPPQPVPVARALCLETGGRLGTDGTVVEALTTAELTRLRQHIEALAPEAVAINLLFSFLDDRFEKAVEAAIPPGIFVSRSSAVLPEYREYERGVSTWLNAWVGPIVERYLQRLAQQLAGSPLAIMQSTGGTMDAEAAARQAVRMLLSGPAGGLNGARFVAAAAQRQRLMSFDMGGTSTDVALIDGALQLTSEGHIGPYPVAIPMVDLHTIGAGGGSIASIDAGGMLRVGPESAGAAPGPACYGRGGRQPTVSDANLVLGRLRPADFLGGALTLDLAAAHRAIGTIAAPLHLSVAETAAGIIRLANEHMARALRLISMERGHDPREFTLVSFGGAGGLHVCALADALGMQAAMIPIHGGVLSALGMLTAPHARQLSRTYNGLLQDISPALLMRHFAALQAAGTAALVREGIATSEITTDYSLDLRYQGQSYTLNLAWQNQHQTTAAFHQAHEQRYGHRLPYPVEVVNVRAGLQGPSPTIRLQPLSDASHPGQTPEHNHLYGIAAPVPVLHRARLHRDQLISGPALITETTATSYIAPQWTAAVDAVGNLLLTRR